MPDIASVKTVINTGTKPQTRIAVLDITDASTDLMGAIRFATLSDLCDLIEAGSEAERLRLYKLVEGSSFRALVGVEDNMPRFTMPMMGPRVEIKCKRCHAEMKQPYEDHECEA